jgi:hypothetical protein
LLASLAVLQACASIDPQAEACPDLSGRYVPHNDREPESLLNYLVERRTAPSTAVVLQGSADSLLVTAGETKVRLAHPADYTCRHGTELVLTRQPTTQLSLPPLIDQSVIRTYVFRLETSGDLALDVYAQSIGRPYGLKLSGPVKLEKSLLWKRSAARASAGP